MAASGPSLQPIQRIDGWRYIAVNDAWRLVPHADILYAADLKWWDVHQGVPCFMGEKWSSHDGDTNDKTECRWRLNLVRGAHRPGFSTDPEVVHYGGLSGFQAINLALLKGATRIVLAGFDMHANGKRHFFGDHPEGLRNTDNYGSHIPAFRLAASACQIPIVNATAGSALDCFPFVESVHG